MLEKLLRAPLPEQIVALLEKLEQDPDTSHLQKVTSLLDSHKTHFTRYETWIIKRALRKLRFTLQRAWTLEKAMGIVINEPESEPIIKNEFYGQIYNGASGLTAGAIRGAALAQNQLGVHQQLVGQYTQEHTKASSLYNGAIGRRV